MSDVITTLNNKTKPISIKYTKNLHGFSNNGNDTNKYIFELIINCKNQKKYFRNFEEIKYSHLITLNHKIKFTDIISYKVSVSLFNYDYNDIFELEGSINTDFSSSTNSNNNIYIEFTQNDMGYVLCSCFYTGYDNNKIFVSPP